MQNSGKTSERTTPSGTSARKKKKCGVSSQKEPIFSAGEKDDEHGEEDEAEMGIDDKPAANRGTEIKTVAQHGSRTRVFVLFGGPSQQKKGRKGSYHDQRGRKEKKATIDSDPPGRSRAGPPIKPHPLDSVITELWGKGFKGKTGREKAT